MLNKRPKHLSYTTWAIIGLQAGAIFFLAGMAVLNFNPFWHFDEAGFLDRRVHWWNTAGQVLTGAGLSIAALAVVGTVAVVVSRCFRGRSWPYLVAALGVACTVIWISPSGFTRNLDAHFEWDAADGFSSFRPQVWDEAAGVWRPEGNSTWRSLVALQVQPLLRGYFRVNDWQKMNGDVPIVVVRIIPITWPVALGSGGETLEDPDQTPLMQAAAQGDVGAVQRLLSAGADVNALDQTGQTALIIACRSLTASPDVVRALLAGNANVNLRSRTGYTALTWAAARNSAEVVRLLRKAGGRP